MTTPSEPKSTLSPESPGAETAVAFLPAGTRVHAARGDTLLDTALDNGIALEHECGGNCACTTCHVFILQGAEFLSSIEDVEADRLTGAEGANPSSRLACKALLLGGNVTVSIPQFSDR